MYMIYVQNWHDKQTQMKDEMNQMNGIVDEPTPPTKYVLKLFLYLTWDYSVHSKNQTKGNGGSIFESILCISLYKYVVAFFVSLMSNQLVRAVKHGHWYESICFRHISLDSSKHISRSPHGPRERNRFLFWLLLLLRIGCCYSM